jgi:hypothetical protein
MQYYEGGNKCLGRLIWRWEDIIKMNLKEVCDVDVK